MLFKTLLISGSKSHLPNVTLIMLLKTHLLTLLDLHEQVSVLLQVGLHVLELGLVLLEQILREVDAVESLEGLPLLGRVEAFVPDGVEFVSEVVDEGFYVGFLHFFKSVHFIFELG